MRINNKAKLYKVLALVLAVSLLAGSIPLAGIGKTARAETPSFFTLQVIRNAALIADDEAIECSFTNNAENGLSQSGSTGADGIWETAYLLGTEYEGGNAFTFTAGEVTVTEEIDLSAVSQYLIIDIADGSHSWADAPVDVSNVVSVTAPEDITGLDNGTAKTKAALGLPDFVNIRLSNGESAAATVTWDVDSCDYDPSSVSAQNFEVEGTVALPSKVANGLSVDLSVSVSVSVGGATNATFTTHPQTQTVSAGATVTLTAEAVNADEDTYQWKKDGAEISGATGKTYTITDASASSAGTYTCTVTGVNGTVVESNAAIISVEKVTLGSFAIDTSVFGNTATRPLEGGIVLTAKNLPADATGTVSYYLGSELLGTGDSYTYMLESYVEEYTFKAVFAGDSKYAAAEAKVTVNVKKSDQPILVWSTAPDDTIEFGVESKYDIFVGGGREGGNYIFSITDQKTVNGEDADAENPIATINESGIYGELVIHNAGSFTVNVYKEGSDDYNDSGVLSKTVVVTKGKYPGFGFENAAPEAITFNDENGNVFVNKAINNKGVDVVYAVVTPEGHTPLATVSDEEPGKIIINSAGTITVSATIAETANYSSAYAEYTLTVNKATQAIAFEKPENAVIYYGEAYANAALEVEVADATDGKGYGAGDITYEIIAGEDIASVDENGKLTFKNGMLGTVTVKATKAACASYLEATAEYTVTVQEFVLNEEPKLEGTAGNNGWYKSDITVTPPEGYKISTSNAIDGDWADNTVVATEGSENKLTVYYRDITTGKISNANEVTSDKLKIDKSAPEELSITLTTSKWYEKILDGITFGVYNSTVNFVLSAKDSVSGVVGFEWKYHRDENAGAAFVEDFSDVADPAAIVKNEDGSYTYIATIGDENSLPLIRGKISFTATDEAGHTSAPVFGEFNILIDEILPEFDVKYEGALKTLLNTETGEKVSEDGDGVVHYYAGESVKVTVTVDEDSFLADEISITDGSDSVVCEWDDNNSTSFDISGEGEHEIAITYTEGSEETKRVTTYTRTVVIDNTAPVITIEPSAAEDIYYSKEPITAKITVDEANFFAEDFKLEIDATNSAGETIEIATPELIWSLVDGKHETTVLLNKEARYVLKANYTDLATNPAEEFVTGELVYDKTAPEIIGNNADNENLKFSYSNPVEELIAAITFNYYQPETAVATITVKAEDEIAGVETIKYKYVREAGASESNVAALEGDAKVISDDGKTYVAEFTLPTDIDDKGQYRGSITAWAIDKAGNNSVQHTDDKMVVVVDSIIPEMMSAEITAKNENAGKYYSNETATVTFKVKEANFYAEDINGCIKVEKDGAAYAYDAITWTQEGDVYTGSITVEDAGTYVVKIEGYKDRSGNALVNYTSSEIIIDKTAPITDIKLYSDDASVEDGKYYQKPVTAKITVTETNFLAKDFKLVVEAKDADNNPVKVEIPALSWTDNGDVHEATVLLDKEARYTVTADYTDLAKTPAKQETTGEFVYDETAPSKDGISISYSANVMDKAIDAITFGYYNPLVEVTVTAKDEVARVKTIEWSYAREAGASETNVETATGVISDLTVNGSTATGKFKLPLDEIENKQFRGSITAWATDNAGNDGSESNKFVDTDYVVIVDTVTPVVSVKYEADRAYDKNTFADVEEADFNAGSTVLISNETATVTYTVTEANFDSDKQDSDYFNKQFVIKKDGVEVNNIKPVWTEAEAADTHTGVITFTEEGDYTVSIAFEDRSGNVTETYESPVIAIDKTAPVISAKYNNAAVKDIYAENVTVEFTVTERHFNPDLFDFSFVKSVDITGAAVPQTVDFTADLRKAANWTHSGDKHTAKITLTNDAIYAFTADCDDMIGHEANQLTSGEFIIDKTAPDTSKIRFEYSASVMDKIIDGITYGFYNENYVTVTFYAEDMTSGVEEFKWNYNRSSDASDANKDAYSGSISASRNEIFQESDKKTFYGEIALPREAAEELRGNMSVIAIDRAGNSSNNDQAYPDNKVIVLDKTKPVIEVEYEQPIQAVDKETLVTQNNVPLVDNSSTEKNNKYIYNANTKVTLKITEANFDLVLKNETTEFKPVVKVNDADYNGTVNWNRSGTSDEWEAVLNFTEDGAYEISVTFTDLSGNKMDDYVSNIVVVDKTAPVIDVEYIPDNNASVSTAENGKTFFGEERKAEIIITEENFRSSDVEVIVTAEDINGNEFTVDFNTLLKKDSSWTHTGNEHKAEIVYSADAIYTFDIEYEDLATNPAADYEPDTFVVDKTPPEKGALNAEYSNSVKDVQDGSVTYKYYKDPITVTLIATDKTAGVKEFNYSYLVSDNVSSKNKGLSDQKLSGSALNSAGDRTTAEFTIPAQSTSENNQFRGNVEFIATDKSGNQSEVFVDKDEIIIFDNIAPKMSVEINDASAVVNGIHYFNNGASATITIEEANFYPEDVKITVNGDPVTLTDWSSNGDVRTATLNLSSDGEYKVYIDYTDRSGNVGDSFESEQIIIDNTKPSITVSGIAHESANNGEKIGFTVSANDDNFNASEFKPVLTAVVPDENGNYKTMTIDVGSPQSVDGKTYRYVIDNLDTDAIYTLSCVAKDLSGNENNVMIISDSGNAEMTAMQFSVNRNGSAYMLDKYTSDLTDKFYIHDVEQNIVIVEVNVDALSEHRVELNGVALTPDKDYTVTVTGGDGASWYKYTYSINAALFAEEGEYSVVVVSKDKTDTTAFSDIKGGAINFVVDRTAPTVTVSGIGKDGRYQASSRTVTVVPLDNGGQLYSVKIVVTDANGNIVATPIELFGDKLTEALANGNGALTFELGEGMYQNVEITCVDIAGNEYFSEEAFHNITVSPSRWVIMWANPVIRWSAVGAVAAIALGIFFIIFFKKRKKDKEEA